MPQRAWTFMVYMAGDNNLSAAGDADLAEMRRIGSSDDVSVVVEFDNAGDRGTRRLHIERDGVGENVVELGETDSGDPDTFVDFVKWSVNEYPAERYALVLWNHGSGWEPEEIDRIARAVDSPGYSEREISERAASGVGRVFFRTSLEKIFALPSAHDRAICSDDGTGHSLDTIELGRVLDNISNMLGGRIDLLGFDACLMANLEVAYEAQPYARHMVGSEENEPNQGWPYDRVLRFITENPAAPTADLAAHIVDSYVQWYGDLDHNGPVTQVALDLDSLPALLDPLDALAAEIEAQMPEAAPEVWRAQRAAARFHHNTLWDLEDLARQLLAVGPTDWTSSIGLVRRALAPGEGPIVAERHRGRSVEHCGGVTLYMVPPITRISPYYAEVRFALERRWLNMLRAYHRS